MSKLDDMIKVFERGSVLRAEIRKCNDVAIEKEEEFKLLMKTIGEAIGYSSEERDYHGFKIRDAWDLLERTVKGLKE